MANILNFDKEMKDILKEYTTELFEEREKSLDKAADYLTEKLALATPRRTGQTANSWTRTTKYKAVRYIGNTQTNDKNIPIVNLLEFGKRGKPFVRKTFNRERENLYKIIKKELE